MANPLPPGPRQPSWLQMLRWVYRPIPFIEECGRRFGDNFSLNFPGFPSLVVTTDPDAIKTLFTASPDDAYAGVSNTILKPILGANNLLMLDGAEHLRRRRLLLPPFHGERMRTYGDTIRQAISDNMQTWPRSQPFPLHPHMQAVTMEVILQAVFGVREGALLHQLRGVLKRVLSFAEQPAMMMMMGEGGVTRFESIHQRLGNRSPVMRFRSYRSEFDALMGAEIDRRRKTEELGDDIFSLLLAARDEDGNALTKVELCDEMLTLLIAGHETTATALSWAFWLLLSNPQSLANLTDSVLAGESDYAAAVAKEALRLRPVLPFVGRTLQVPMNVGGRDYDVGTTLAPSTYLTHRRADLWPEPTTFKPERFIGAGNRPYAFFPFGGGVRRCIGMAFALYEMQIVLSEVVANATLHAVPGYTAVTKRRGVTFCPSEGMPVVAQVHSARKQKVA